MIHDSQFKLFTTRPQRQQNPEIRVEMYVVRWRTLALRCVALLRRIRRSGELGSEDQGDAVVSRRDDARCALDEA